jgi:hypothetical protein
VLFPLGLTQVRTPAASARAGHLLATLGPAGKLAALSLLFAAGLAVAASLLIWPPADPPAAAWRLAVALALLFALSPATRFGYFSYPIGLLGWLAIGAPGSPTRRRPPRLGGPGRYQFQPVRSRSQARACRPWSAWKRRTVGMPAGAGSSACRVK